MATPSPASHTPLPEVRLELRNSSTLRSASYLVPDDGFLIGTVPGCDLRLSAKEHLIFREYEAALGSANWKRPAEFSSVNGTVSLELPTKASADVHASTVNGRIKTDFPLEVTGRFAGRHANGRIGNGGPELKISTVNGSINLRQQGGPTI